MEERHGFLSFNDIQSDYYQIPSSDLDKIKQEEEKLRGAGKKSEEDDISNKDLDLPSEDSNQDKKIETDNRVTI